MFPAKYAAMVDGGLSFFGGLGVTLLGLAAIEKMGVPINETAVRIVVWIGGCVAVGYAVLKKPLLLWL